MNFGAAAMMGLLAIAFLVLLFATFGGENPPSLARLFFFLLLLGVTAALAYYFFVGVLKYDPDPMRLRAAHFLTDSRFMDFTEVVPGAYGLKYVRRLDADGEEEKVPEEWLVFYQYDVRDPPEQAPTGPFGAILYDSDNCRPPSILSFDLVPAHRDYLGEDAVDVRVEDIIPFQDPLSGGQDRPEILITGVGATRKVVTDLNIFRKVGVEENYCLLRRQAQTTPVPNWTLTSPYGYQNIGSFRGNYQVRRSKASVTVIDRAGFERSQIVVKRLYTPADGTGSYFHAGTQDLLEPIEYTLDFAPDRQPDEVTRVYYPEKAVLAFYLLLGKDDGNLDKANGYLSEKAQGNYDIRDHKFGLALPRDELAQVLIWELRYEPDIAAEQAHQDRLVTIQVVGKDERGIWHETPPRLVTWRIVGKPKTDALPYGCEWKLDEIVSVVAP